MNKSPLKSTPLARAVGMALGVFALSGAALAGAPSSGADHCLNARCSLSSLASFDGMAGGSGGQASSTEAPHYGSWGVDTSGMDRSVKPGDNFYDFVNGTATRNMVIPADRSGIGSFDLLELLSEARSRALVEGLAAKSGLSGDDAKIAEIYRGMMDEAAVEQLGLAPLKPELATIAAIKSKAEMAAFMGKTMGDFGTSVFSASIGADDKNPKFNALRLGQAGLGLPDRDYYLQPGFADKKAKYQAYVATLLGLLGHADAEKEAKAIVAMETEIAKASWTRIERRDTSKTYNAMDLAQLPRLAPGFEWQPFLQAAGLSSAKKVIVTEKSAFPRIAKIYAATPLETLKAWEAFHAADQAAPYLSSAFVTATWQFRAHELGGAQEQRPRWKRAVGTVELTLGDALGREYVAAYFPAESKAKMEALVADLRGALKDRIEHLGWMSEATRARALEKLAKFGVKIGYPDKWRDYSKLEVKPGDLFGNMQRSSAFEWNFLLGKLDQPVDPSEWQMTPQTVNAYYDATRNEIVFPAAILQAPFFDPQADKAVNYGGIGGVIGHEITHGFDDEGRHYDGGGKLAEWWTAADSAKFDAQAKKYGLQFDQYEPLPGVHVQGALTMGENIADLGGNLLALDAYHRSLNGMAAPVLDGFTGDQRVFLGFAQVWRSKYRDDAVKRQVASDPHTPDAFRAIGPVRNVDAWYEAFDVKPGDKYYLAPKDRVRIW
jgi:putative endopeptidase